MPRDLPSSKHTFSLTRALHLTITIFLHFIRKLPQEGCSPFLSKSWTHSNQGSFPLLHKDFPGQQWSWTLPNHQGRLRSLHPQCPGQWDWDAYCPFIESSHHSTAEWDCILLASVVPRLPSFLNLFAWFFPVSRFRYEFFFNTILRNYVQHYVFK